MEARRPCCADTQQLRNYRATEGRGPAEAPPTRGSPHTRSPSPRTVRVHRLYFGAALLLSGASGPAPPAAPGPLPRRGPAGSGRAAAGGGLGPGPPAAPDAAAPPGLPRAFASGPDSHLSADPGLWGAAAGTLRSPELRLQSAEERAGGSPWADTGLSAREAAAGPGQGQSHPPTASGAPPSSGAGRSRRSTSCSRACTRLPAGGVAVRARTLGPAHPAPLPALTLRPQLLPAAHQGADLAGQSLLQHLRDRPPDSPYLL